MSSDEPAESMPSDEPTEAMPFDEKLADIKHRLTTVPEGEPKPDDASVEKALEILRGMYAAAPDAGVEWQEPDVRLGEILTLTDGTRLPPSVVIEWSDNGNRLKLACPRPIVPNAIARVLVTREFKNDNSTTKTETDVDYVNLWKIWQERL